MTVVTATDAQSEQPPVAAAPGAPPRPARDWRKKSRGQSIVEFAMITPLLFLMLALAADFGRAFTAYITISSAAREGAAYGAASLTNADDTAGIKAAAMADAPNIWGVAPTVSVSNAKTQLDTWKYRYVEVTVNYTFSPIMRVPPIPNSVSMTRKVRMRVVN